MKGGSTAEEACIPFLLKDVCDPSPPSAFRPQPAASTLSLSLSLDWLAASCIERLMKQNTRSLCFPSIVFMLQEELVGTFGTKKGSVEGIWRLVWSSQTSDSNPFAKPEEVLGGECYQVVSASEADRRKGRVENIVSWPWLGGLLLRGGATYEETGEGRVVVTIDSFTLEGTSPILFTLPLLKLTDSTEFVVQDAPRSPESPSQCLLSFATECSLAPPLDQSCVSHPTP